MLFNKKDYEHNFFVKLAPQTAEDPAGTGLPSRLLYFLLWEVQLLLQGADLWVPTSGLHK